MSNELVRCRDGRDAAGGSGYVKYCKVPPGRFLFVV